ncbi:MAG: anti-sigma factor [Burkholderiales bacterium]
MNLSRPDRVERLDALAAAYVLGTMPARARARLARMARTDTAVRAAIRAWEERLAPLAESAPPVNPSPQVWKRVALRLGLDATPHSERSSWWGRLSFWRGLAVASLAAAVVLAVSTLRQHELPASQSLVAVLAGEDQKPALVISMDRGSRTASVKAVGGVPVPDDRSLELWMLPQGAAPRSLGIVPASGTGVFTLPALPEVALAGVPALAVTLEQKGGSPTGAAQGPVLYTGRIERMY